MILCDREIELALDKRRFFILPRPDPKDIASTAVDLRLDGILDRWEFPSVNPALGQVPLCFKPGMPGYRFSELERIYTKQEDISKGFILETASPKNFVLGWTLETIYFPHTSRLCARVEGKSSLARIGLGVHVTAPTIHAGFGFNVNNPNDNGAKLRLEIWNFGPLPIELVKGMRICQLVIEEVREVPKAGYAGQFNLQGPRPSP